MRQRVLSDAELAVVAASHCPWTAADYAGVVEDEFTFDSSDEFHVLSWTYEQKVALLFAIAQYGPKPN